MPSTSASALSSARRKVSWDCVKRTMKSIFGGGGVVETPTTVYSKGGSDTFSGGMSDEVGARMCLCRLSFGPEERVVCECVGE